MIARLVAAIGQVVLFQDKKQMPPHVAGQLRNTSYEKLLKKFYGLAWSLPIAAAKPLHAVLDHMQQFILSRCPVTDLPVSGAGDAECVRVATHPCLLGLISEAQAYAMEPVNVPALLFVETNRLRPLLGLLIGLSWYQEALARIANQKYGGPLPPGRGAMQFENLPNSNL